VDDNISDLSEVFIVALISVFLFYRERVFTPTFGKIIEFFRSATSTNLPSKN